MENEFLSNPVSFVGHCHSPTIVEYKNQLYASWYVYEETENDKAQIVYSLFDKANKKWNKSQYAFPMLKGMSQGNPVLCNFNNTLSLFFVILKRHYWDSAEIFTSQFDDKSSTWSVPRKVNTPEGVMIRHRPMIVSGKAIIPAYDEKKMTTILYSFSNDTAIWTEYSKIPDGGIQGDLVSFNDHECQLYLRASGDNNKIIKTVSADSGKTWEIRRATTLFCPLSGIAAILLKSGNILVAHNHTEQHKRNPISLSLSDSKGVHFDLGIWHVDKSNIELSYPTLFQDSSEIIHLVFTFNRKSIKHISFTEVELRDYLEK